MNGIYEPTGTEQPSYSIESNTPSQLSADIRVGILRATERRFNNKNLTHYQVSDTMMYTWKSSGYKGKDCERNRVETSTQQREKSANTRAENTQNWLKGISPINL